MSGQQQFTTNRTHTPEHHSVGCACSLDISQRSLSERHTTPQDHNTETPRVCSQSPPHQTIASSSKHYCTSIDFEHSLRSATKQPPPDPALPDTPEAGLFLGIERGVAGGDIA